MIRFSPESLDFFRGFARHNAKPWFEARREDYEQHVKQPTSPPSGAQRRAVPDPTAIVSSTNSQK